MKTLASLAVACSAMLVAPLSFSTEIQTYRGAYQFESSPKSVVAFPAGVIDTLDALGVEVEGVPNDLFLDYVDTNQSKKVGSLFTADLEKVHHLQPDIVIVGERSALQFDAVSEVAPVIDLSIPRGNTFRESLKRMHTLATLFHKEQEAERIEHELIALKDKVKQLINPNESVMVVMLMGRSLNVLSSETRIDWFQQELGMKLEASDVKTLHEVAPISYEYILAKNPDWLIVMDRDASVGRSATDMSKSMMDTPLVHATKAWQNDHVIYLNGIGTLNSVGGVQGIKHTLSELANSFSSKRNEGVKK